MMQLKDQQTGKNQSFYCVEQVKIELAAAQALWRQF